MPKSKRETKKEQKDDFDIYFDQKRNSHIRNILYIFLPSDLINLLLEYDISFLFQFRESPVDGVLLYYKKKVWLCINCTGYELHLLDPLTHEKKTFLVSLQLRVIFHDGWQKENNCEFRKRGDFDEFGDSYEEKFGYWIINGQKVNRNIKGEVIFKRSSKLYTATLHSFYWREWKPSDSPWQLLVLKKNFFSGVNWYSWSIFNTYVLVTLTPFYENFEFLHLKLHLYNIKEKDNCLRYPPLEPFLSFPVKTPMPYICSSILATQNTIHVVAKSRNQTWYYRFDFPLSFSFE